MYNKLIAYFKTDTFILISFREDFNSHNYLFIILSQWKIDEYKDTNERCK